MFIFHRKTEDSFLLTIISFFLQNMFLLEEFPISDCKSSFLIINLKLVIFESILNSFQPQINLYSSCVLKIKLSLFNPKINAMHYEFFQALSLLPEVKRSDITVSLLSQFPILGGGLQNTRGRRNHKYLLIGGQKLKDT